MPHFDTLRLVKRLQSDGAFSEQQAIHLCEALEETLRATFDFAIQQTASQADHDQLAFRSATDLGLLRDQLKSESLRSQQSLQSMQEKLREEVRKSRNDVTLDQSLEKSRIADLFKEHRAGTEKLSNELTHEIARIEKAMVEQKYDLIRISLGTLASIAALMLAYIRIVM